MSLCALDFRSVGAALLALLLAGCVAPVQPPPALPEGAPEDFPSRLYLEASRSEPVYRIDPRASQVVIYVYRAGPLARLGHDHVVVSRDVQGYALVPEQVSRARTDVYFPVATLSVDEPALRAAAGFTTELSADDIEGTRQRMLRAVLRADQHPFVRARAVPRRGTPPRLTLSVDLTLHGVTRALEIPVELALDGGRFSAEGSVEIRQTDFEITPFSVLGGALAVKDELRIHFRLRGVRIGSGN